MISDHITYIIINYIWSYMSIYSYIRPDRANFRIELYMVIVYAHIWLYITIFSWVYLFRQAVWQTVSDFQIHCSHLWSSRFLLAIVNDCRPFRPTMAHGLPPRGTSQRGHNGHDSVGFISMSTATVTKNTNNINIFPWKITGWRYSKKNFFFVFY